MNVEVIDAQRRHRVTFFALGGFVRRIARALPKTDGGEVTVLLCGDARMRGLNARFRGKDKTTDVLSFPSGGDLLPDGERALGDIVISVPQAARQAGRAGHALARELRLLVLHGYLHLLGYDHEVDDGTMRRLEARLAKRLLAERPMSGIASAWAVAAALLLLAVDLVLSVVTLSASALSRVALRRMNTESGNRLRFLEEFKTVPSEHRAAVHTLRELALLGAVGLIAWVSAEAGWPGGFWGGLALGALIAVVLVEGVLARWLALQDPRTALRLASGLVRGARFVTWPLLVPVNAVFRRPAHEVDEDDDRDDDDDDEDVEAFIEVGEREGILEKSEGEMVRGIVDLDQTLVREIMTPRVDVVVLPAAATVDEARRIALEAGHSRFPVFGESIDHIVGILHVRDLLRASDPSWKEPGIAGLLRPPLFVPATRTVKEVLAEMRTRAHVALCVDEYGGFAGMVTLEDLLEEIVGEIRDEHEHEDTPLRAEAGGSWLVSGLAHADELERLFGVDLGERDYDTVGGFVTSALGRVPGPGERFASRGLAVEIVEADPRRVWRVRVRPTEARS